MPLRTYQNYERGEREPDLRTVLALMDRGWSPAWLLTGEGPERMDQVREDAAAYAASQEVSGADLMIATELAEERLKRTGDWLPKPLFFDLVAEVLAAHMRGIPYADILGFEPSARDFGQLERSDDGGQGVARSDQGDPQPGAAGAAKRRG